VSKHPITSGGCSRHEGAGEEVSLLQGSFPPQLFILLLHAISEVYVKVIEKDSTSLLVRREYAFHFAPFPKALVYVIYQASQNRLCTMAMSTRKRGLFLQNLSCPSRSSAL